jgi:hypothetical protein
VNVAAALPQQIDQVPDPQIARTHERVVEKDERAHGRSVLSDEPRALLGANLEDLDVQRDNLAQPPKGLQRAVAQMASG